jgi:hypothetical protein
MKKYIITIKEVETKEVEFEDWEKLRDRLEEDKDNYGYIQTKKQKEFEEEIFSQTLNAETPYFLLDLIMAINKTHVP